MKSPQLLGLFQPRSVHRVVDRRRSIQASVLPLTSISEFQLPHRQNGNNMYLTGVIRGPYKRTSLVGFLTQERLRAQALESGSLGFNIGSFPF